MSLGLPASLPHQRGIALVVVLWLVALLSLMAVSQTAAVRTDTQIVGNLVDAAGARAAAYAGIQFAVADLVRPLPAREMSTDASVYALSFEQAKLFVSIRDESGKVDINTAPETLLAALLKASGVDKERRPALVEAILDWRDRDELRRVNGAEKEEYRAAGLSYGPRNAPFQSLEELALVLGFDASLYHALEDNITIYSGSPTINPAAASPEVLQALNSGEEDGDGAPTAEDAQGAAAPVRGMVSGGNVFSIYVEARLASGARERIEAVVRLSPPRANAPMRYEFLRWREGVASKVKV